MRFTLEGKGFTAVGNVNGKPGYEIITNVGIFAGNDGKNICRFSEEIGDPAPGIFSADDDHGVVAGVSNQKLFIFDGRNCNTIRTVALSTTGGGPINIADFEGSGVLGFGTAGRNAYTAVGSDGLRWSAASHDHSSEFTGSTTFDFNGSGNNQIIYADEVSLRVIDGANGRIIYTAEHASYTARETPIVADVTGSGKARIVVGANSCLGNTAISGIRVFRDPADAWVKTRPIWNQQNFNPLLVGENGELVKIHPTKIYKPWLKSSHLTGFRNNIPMSKSKVAVNKVFYLELQPKIEHHDA